MCKRADTYCRVVRKLCGILSGIPNLLYYSRTPTVDTYCGHLPVGRKQRGIPTVAVRKQCGMPTVVRKQRRIPAVVRTQRRTPTVDTYCRKKAVRDTYCSDETAQDTYCRHLL